MVGRGLLLLVAACVGAAEPLAVELAIARALDRNEAPALALARIAQARAGVAAAEAARRPVVGLDAHAAVHQPAAHDVADDRGLRLAATWRFANPGALSAVRAAEHAAWAANQDAAGERRALAFAVVEAVIDARTADAQADAARGRVAVAVQAAAQAQDRIAAGTATAVDVARAQLDVAQAERSLALAAGAAIEARLLLGELLAGEPPTLLAAPPEPLEPAGTPSDLVRRAGQLREDLQAQDLRAAAATHTLAQAHAAWLPWAEAGGTVVRGAGDGSAAEPAWSASLHGAWLLLDGGARQAEIVRAEADLLHADRTWSVLGRGIAHEVRRAAAALATVRATALVADRAVDLARRHHAELAGRERSGMATALEAADARSALAEAEAQAIAASGERQRAGYRLRRAVGLWPLTAVEP